MAVSRRHGVDPFAEHAALMKELFHEYNRTNGLEAMALVEALLQEAQQTAHLKTKSVQTLISEMSRSVSELEQLGTYPEPEGLHAKRVASLQAQAHTAESSTTALQAELRELEQKRDALAARVQAANERRTSNEKAAIAEETLLRHQLSLFAHISKITWRLDRDDRIAGTVSDPKSGDLRPFDLDPRGGSEFEVVNALWRMV